MSALAAPNMTLRYQWSFARHPARKKTELQEHHQPFPNAVFEFCCQQLKPFRRLFLTPQFLRAQTLASLKGRHRIEADERVRQRPILKALLVYFLRLFPQCSL